MYSKYVIFSLNIIKMYWYYILRCPVRNIESFFQVQIWSCV